MSHFTARCIGSLSCCAWIVLSLQVFAAPTVTTRNPAPDATVSALTSVSITFNEAVTGVDADDLLINGEFASSVTGSGAGPYVFGFTQPPPGAVGVEFAGDHGIAGQGGTGPLTPPLPWNYTLTDTIAPTAPNLTPANGATLGVLTEVAVIFSEPVLNMDAADLLVNGVAATGLTGSGSGPYVFTVAQPLAGAVNFTWAAGHGITDAAASPNAFGGAAWSATLSASGPGSLVINEFLTANGVGLADENGDQEDWIEIRNTGATAVNLVGWALTNELDEPAKWVFPSRTLNAGAYLVVFASGKNRKPGSGNLHTNFKLNENGGNLALLSPDSPRAVANEFASYPEQRFDYSYGRSGAQVRYFSPPTPNAANTTTALTTLAAQPSASVSRGFFKDPFQLVLSCATAGATIRYTTNGTEPTAATGTVYAGPISISGTTTLRAAAFGTGFVPSATVTHSYIFLDQVLTQPNNPAGFPNNWGAHASFAGGLVPADYEMDPEIVNNPAYTQMLKDGLRELPIVSVVMPMADIFSASGWYFNPNITNKSFPDKKCSVEMILPDGSTAFATTCGINGHGNASRDPLKNPKHGFKLNFKGDFGATKLEYRLFPDSPVEEFEDLILRPDFNSGWRHWSDTNTNASGYFQRTRASRTRDAWVKDAARAMGVVASHNRYCHLFINGLYWGTYDFTEQPTASFGAAYFGGTESDYDVYDQGTLKNGDAAVYTALTGLAPATTNAIYDQHKNYLDITEFIDYTLLHFYLGHQDWGLNKNWYGLRQRAGGTFSIQGKFKYIPWDGECVLLEPNVNRAGDPDVPSGLHVDLDDNPQYRLDFADRVHRHLIAPGGALTSAENIARWQRWQAIVDKPVVAESARWGDYRRDVHPYQEGTYLLYTRNDQWAAENTRMVGTYFPGRNTTLLSQLRAVLLYPAATAGAPEIRTFISGSTQGALLGTGQMNAGAQIEFTLPAGTSGTTFYTTDGTDPRVYYAGTVAPGALTYTLDTPIAINATTTIKSRVRNGATWSALNEAALTVGVFTPPVRITEIMYNPPAAAGGTAAEFLELLNTGSQAVDLSGWSFTGIDFVFPLGSMLGAGDRLVIASNNSPSVWAAQYPGVVRFGYFADNLSNAGERIGLIDAAGRTVVSVDYDDVAPWPTSPDGGGYSLEVIDPLGDPDNPYNWKASAALKGTPGLPNSVPPPPLIELNEVLARSSTAADFVELRNPGASPVNVGGWTVNGVAIAGDTIIPAGGFHVVSMLLADAGGDVQLKNGATMIDAVRYGNQATDHSIGRVAGVWVLTTPSPGAANAAAATAPVNDLALNEWLANALPGAPDWIELFNKHASLPVALSGVQVKTSGQIQPITALAFLDPLGFLQLFCDEVTGVNHLDFTLPAAGTTLALIDAAGTQFDSVTFGAQTQGVSQGRLPNGTGANTTFTGSSSPGASNYTNTWNGPLLNEIVARNLAGAQAPWGARPDWVELYNPTSSPFSLAGLKLGASANAATAWTIPAGTSIPAFGHLAIWCDGGQPASTSTGADLNTGFPLDDFSGGLYLFNSSGQVVNSLEWGFQIVDRSIGVDAGVWKLPANPTRGTANAAAATLGAAGALRINEWMTAPSSGGDWFELYNTSASPVALAGLFLSDDPSEIGRTKFKIAALSFIDGHGWVRWDADSAPELGRNHVNFALDAGAEFLRLSAADITLIDAVSFGLQTTGVSQGRITDGTANIVAMPGSPTPGASNILLPAPSIDTQPESQTVAQGGNASFSIAASGSAPLTFQWKFNGAELPGETGVTLALGNVQSGQDGRYTCVVKNTAGTLLSATAMLYVQQTFAQWAAAKGLGGGAAADGDAEFDSLTNGLEYLLNLDPLAPPTAQEVADALPRVGMEIIGETRYLTLTYRQSARAIPSALHHQLSPTLGNGSWTNVTPDITEPLGLDPITGDPRVRVKVAIGAGETRKYLRLEVVP